MKPNKIPMEWMGPATWRLPSGKALAEFALQAGFLAPLLFGDREIRLAISRKGPVQGNDMRGKLTKASR